MGTEITKKIIQSRTYVDPKATTPPDLDYYNTYPITVYGAVYRTYNEGDRTLSDELNIIDDKINTKQDIIPPGYELDIMSFTGQPGQIGGLKRVINIDPNPSNRSDNKIATEKAVGTYADTKASITDFNNHNNDDERHIDSDERDSWNDKVASAIFITHDNDIVRHVTSIEKDLWNSKASETDLQSHRSNINNPHKVTAAQLGVYTKLEVDSMLERQEVGFFKDMNLSYDGVLSVRVVPYNSDNYNPNFFLEFGEGLPPIIDQSQTFIALRASTNYLTSASNIVEIWIKRPNLVWSPGNPSTAVLRNGDLFIQYPNNEIWIWIGGKFKLINTISG